MVQLTGVTVDKKTITLTSKEQYIALLVSLIDLNTLVDIIVVGA